MRATGLMSSSVEPVCRKMGALRRRFGMRLQGKIALVTGGASGMGKSEATIFAREGARVVVADVLEADGKGVAQAIGDAARFVKLDVTNEAEWQTAVAFAEREFGKLDILVNNAGIGGTYTSDLQ